MLRIPTALLSDLSDRLCAPLVAYSASPLANAIFVPAYFIEMLLLIEDKRFTLHFGIDPFSIIRAIVFDLRGCALQGGSTIPQQLYNVRVYRANLPPYDRTLAYKLRQSAWAISNTTKLSRVRILTEYIADVYFGRSLYGLVNATKGYFDKSPSEITVAQAFFLSERIAAPNRISPQRIANLLSRRAIVKALKKYQANVDNVINLYDNLHGCGAEICRLLEK